MSKVCKYTSQYIEMMEDMFPDGTYVLATGDIDIEVLKKIDADYITMQSAVTNLI